MGYNNFFNTKEYNIFNGKDGKGKDNKKDELRIEHNDQSDYLGKHLPRGFRNINFNSYSMRPSIVSKK